jgi:hypothetical protein
VQTLIKKGKNKMTKKHLVNIAKMIKATKTKKELVKSLIKYFEAENPLFNKKRFLEAIK